MEPSFCLLCEGNAELSERKEGWTGGVKYTPHWSVSGRKWSGFLLLYIHFTSRILCIYCVRGKVTETNFVCSLFSLWLSTRNLKITDVHWVSGLHSVALCQLWWDPFCVEEKRACTEWFLHGPYLVRCNIRFPLSKRRGLSLQWNKNTQHHWLNAFCIL